MSDDGYDKDTDTLPKQFQFGLSKKLCARADCKGVNGRRQRKTDSFLEM